MRQPKFPMGEVFEKDFQVVVFGKFLNNTVKGVVTKIEARASDRDTFYMYTISDRFPQPYDEPRNSEQITEGDIEKGETWRKVENG